MADGPQISGIHAVMITVRDFAPHLRLYQDGFGWQVVARGEVDRADALRLWEVPSPAEVVVLAPLGVTSGRIHLARFPEVSVRPAPHPGPLDLGYFALDVYVRDLFEARRRCEAAGAIWAGGPARWQVGEGTGAVTVTQGFVHAAESVNVTLVVAGRPRATAVWTQDPTAFCTELTSVVVRSDVVDRSKEFWEALGLTTAYDAVFTQPEMARMVNLPEGVPTRLVFGIGSETARLEIVGDPPGTNNSLSRTIADQLSQRPGRGVGQSLWIVQCRDLSTSIRLGEEAGGRLAGAPLPVNNPIHGRRTVATMITPEGTLLELWQE